jgi:ApaG protein
MTNPNIYKAITQGVEVYVKPNYETAQSNPSLGRFIFSYAVHIINNSPDKIKLIYRNWEIYDSLVAMRTVSGEGVVGVQPTLESGMAFDYQSWCPLQSGIGKMKGFYTFENLTEGNLLKIIIPEFILVADYIHN